MPGKHQALTADQSRAIFGEAAADSPWRALYHVLVSSAGCDLVRHSALTWSDVDLPAGRLAVRQAVTYDHARKVVLAEPKTRGSRRSITIPVELVHELLSEQLGCNTRHRQPPRPGVPQHRRIADPPEPLVSS
jgi:hypothetical protein